MKKIGFIITLIFSTVILSACQEQKDDGVALEQPDPNLIENFKYELIFQEYSGKLKKENNSFMLDLKMKSETTSKEELNNLFEEKITSLSRISNRGINLMSDVSLKETREPSVYMETYKMWGEKLSEIHLQEEQKLIDFHSNL